MRSSVVLPQPDGPSSAKNSRSWISSVRPSTAVKSPKRLVTCSNVTTVPPWRHANHICDGDETARRQIRILPTRLALAPAAKPAAVARAARGLLRRRQCGSWRGRRRHQLLHRLEEQLARLRPVIVAEPHHRARMRQDRDDPVEQRLAGNRLLQELVDAEPRGLDHAPALDMAGEHDDRNVGHRETRRASARCAPARRR